MKDRNLLISRLKEVGENIAKERGITQKDVKVKDKLGVWGADALKHLEKEHGDCSEEITWIDDNGQKVEFRYRFSDPVLSVLYKGDNGQEIMASIEYSNFNHITKEYDSEFAEHEYMVWGGRKGIELLNDLLEKCKNVLD